MIRKGITKVLISVFAALLCVMPFSLRTYADGAEADDPGYIAAVEFFRSYHLISYENPNIILDCTSNQTNYCSIYQSQDMSVTDSLYNVMEVIDGLSYVSPTAYTTSNRLRVTKEPLYLVFLSNVNWTNSNIALYPQSGYQVSVERVTNNTQTVMTPNGYYLITLKMTAVTVPTSGTVWASLALPGSNTTKVIPFYKGPQIGMPDNLHRIVFGTSQTYNVNDPAVVAAINAMNSNITTKADELYDINQLAADYAYGILKVMNEVTNPRLQNIYNILNQGDQYTSPSVNSNDDQNSDLSTSIDSLVNQEDDFNNDMQQNLNNINFQGSDQFLQTGMLSTSAHWVKTQYNRMVSGNVIGSLISYALLFGLGILIVGKMR